MSTEVLERERPAKSARRGFPFVKASLVLVAFAILMALGTWQVERLRWKEGLLAAIKERTHSQPVSLAEIERMQSDGKAIEYRPVRVSGTFDNSKERDFFATYEGATGYFIYTPLTTDSGETVFINRGFVPYDRKDPATRPESLASGHVTITGLARTAPARKPSYMVPDNDIGKNIFYWKDLKTMASSVGLPAGTRLVPFFIDADKVPGAHGLPIGGVTFIALPNNHLQYAITWYGLAAVLLVVAGSSFFGRRKPR